MKHKIVIKSFSALSYDVVAPRTVATGLDTPIEIHPRPRLTLGCVEGLNVLTGGPTEASTANTRPVYDLALKS